MTLGSTARVRLDNLLDTLHQILPTVAPSATRVQMPSQERRVLYQMELECEVEEALSPRMVIITQPSDNLAQQHGRGEKFLRQRHWELDQGLVFVKEGRGAQNQLPSLGPRGDMFERGRGGGIDCALPWCPLTKLTAPKHEKSFRAPRRPPPRCRATIPAAVVPGDVFQQLSFSVSGKGRRNSSPSSL